MAVPGRRGRHNNSEHSADREFMSIYDFPILFRLACVDASLPGHVDDPELHQTMVSIAAVGQMLYRGCCARLIRRQPYCLTISAQVSL
jgi:hypothetical protein